MRPYLATWHKAYLAPAPQAQIRMPGAQILANARVDNIRRVTLGLNGSAEAATMSLVVPGAAKLTRIAIGRKTVAVPKDWANDKHVVIGCLSADCSAMAVTLDMEATGPLDITVIERRAGLPGFATKLAAARPGTAVPSQFGDGIVLLTPLTVPAAK